MIIYDIYVGIYEATGRVNIWNEIWLSKTNCWSFKKGFKINKFLFPDSLLLFVGIQSPSEHGNGT